MGRHRKLTEEQIKEVCQSNESARDLAKRFGVSYITILNYRRKYGTQKNTEAGPNVV